MNDMLLGAIKEMISDLAIKRDALRKAPAEQSGAYIDLIGAHDRMCDAIDLLRSAINSDIEDERR